MSRLAAIRRRCLTDLYFFVTEVLYHSDKHKYGELHRWMCATIGKTAGTREMWLLPRDHFKTTILTIGHSMQQILRDPAYNFFLASSKEEHSGEWSDEIRRQFASNLRLKALFPPWCARSMDDFGSRSTWTTPAREYFGVHRREPTCTVLSFKGRVESKHYRGGYLDDCMSEEDTSETGLKEAQENFKKFIPLIDTDGILIMPGTRKHYNDIYQRAMDTEAFKVYVRHGLEDAKRDCDLDECSRFAAKHPAPDFKVGTPLCSERMDRKAYDEKLKLCEIDPKLGSSYFWHEYMNIPFSPSDRKFQPRWFVRIDDKMIPGQHEPFDPLNKWIALDSAWKDDEHPSGFDFTVFLVGGFDEHGRLYILDILRSREWTMKQGADAMITAMKVYGISRVITEKVGQVTFHTYFKDRCRQAGIPVQLITPKRGGVSAKSKHDRIMSCQGYFEQGRVFFRRAAENFEDCVNEFCNLGRWTNDDIADALSDFFDEQVKVLAPPAPQKAGQVVAFRPMPFDGAGRRAAYSQAAAPRSLQSQLGRNEQIAIDANGNQLFTPEQVDMFATRSDKETRPVAAFRPFR